MDSLIRAFEDSQRSYLAAKAAVSRQQAALLYGGASSGGGIFQRGEHRGAAEAYRAFRSWVYCAVGAIGRKVAGQPVKVFRGKRQLTSHPLLDLLSDPSELSTGWQVLYSTMCSLELTGQSLWWLPLVNGRRRILPIPSSWIVACEGTSKRERWLVRPPQHAGEPMPIDSIEACYFSYPDPADPRGCLSPLVAAAAAVNIDASILVSQNAGLSSVFPTFAIHVAQHRDNEGEPTGRKYRLNGAQQDQLIRAIRERYKGASRHGEPFILDGLIDKVERLSWNPSEMDWLSSSKATKERILQVFGVNEVIIGQVEGVNRASSLAAEMHFAHSTVNPKLRLLSECMTEWLCPHFGDGLRIEVEPVIPDDSELRFRQMQMLGSMGAATVDELRAYAGLPALGFGYGGDLPPEGNGGAMKNIGLAFAEAIISEMRMQARTEELIDHQLDEIYGSTHEGNGHAR